MGVLAKTKDFFGLDIGTTGIRVVKLSGDNTSRRLESYADVAIDSKLGQSQAPTDYQKIAQIVKQLVVDSGIKTRNVVIGVPSKHVFASVVETANMTPQELKKSMGYLAEQYIPVPIDQVKLDWAQLGQAPSDPNKQEVLLLSARNSFTETRLEVLESIGLDVVGVQPDALAMSRALIPASVNDAVMVLNIGATSSDVALNLAGAPRLIRSIPVGSQIFARSIMQSMGVDAEQANQFLFKFGLKPDKLEGQVQNAIQPNVHVLVDEVKKSLQFFTGRYKGQNVSKIIITGRGSGIPDLALHIVNQTQVAVEIGNSWVNVQYPQGSHEELMSISTQYSVAVGLAEANL
jgi:type IV pilus assembly protein PilM